MKDKRQRREKEGSEEEGYREEKRRGRQECGRGGNFLSRVEVDVSRGE